MNALFKKMLYVNNVLNGLIFGACLRNQSISLRSCIYFKVLEPYVVDSVLSIN